MLVTSSVTHCGGMATQQKEITDQTQTVFAFLIILSFSVSLLIYIWLRVIDSKRTEAAILPEPVGGLP